MRGREMLAAIAVMAVAPTAMADVTWEAPPECGAVEQLAARVDAQLGRRVEPEELTAHAIVIVEDGAYRATLRLGDGTPRVLTGATCGEVTDAIALILALAIREAAPPPPSPEVEPPPPAVESPPTPRRRDRASIELDLGVELGGDALLLPAPALGVGPALRIAHGAWAARLSASLWDAQIAHDGSVIATEVGLVSGQLALCRRLGLGDGCVVGVTGRMTGTGLVGADAASAARWWSAAGVHVGGRRALGRRFVVDVGVDALISLVRPRFVFDDGRDAYRAPAVTLRLGITLTTRILAGD